VRLGLAKKVYDETGQILLKRGIKWHSFYGNGSCYEHTKRCIDNLDLEKMLAKDLELLLSLKPHDAKVIQFPRNPDH
jgi:hypothetical protein